MKPVAISGFESNREFAPVQAALWAAIIGFTVWGIWSLTR